jgi:SAM-dependent methyltransferase
MAEVTFEPSTHGALAPSNPGTHASSPRGLATGALDPWVIDDARSIPRDTSQPAPGPDSSIYSRVLRRALAGGLVSRHDRVLVVCGGPTDRNRLFEAGFTDVTVTNVDDRMRAGLFPYPWQQQDAENLALENDSFDVAVVHAGLHHCHSPHRALLEMFRVARRAVIVIEARDSFAMNLAKRLGFAIDYEIEAVSDDGYEAGGVGNGPIPNYIYRWTEREVVKTIASFDPTRAPRVKFFYGLRLPHQRFANTERPLLRMALSVLGPMIELFAKALPKQGNEFAFVISKAAPLQPWLTDRGGGVRVDRATVRRMGRAYRGSRAEG